MIGDTVGSYRIVAKLGEGGMGAVYLAEHTLIGRQVAIKILLPQYSHNAMVCPRFFNEARATAMIRHGGLVDVLDYGHHRDGSAYLVMEYLDGETLKAAIKRQGRFETPMLVELTRQVSMALAAAHAAGIVHRDLKPENIFLVPTTELPSGMRVKVLDFGVAKLTDEFTGSDMKTRSGALLGTPRYMSPEQCRGAGKVDHRADIYSFGCILFEMACGRPAFDGAGPGDLIAAHLAGPVPSPREVYPEVAELWERVIVRALAKSPDDRFASFGDLLRTVDPEAPALPSPGRIAPPEALVAAPLPGALLPGASLTGTSGSLRPARPNPWPAIGIVAAAIALVAVGLLLWPAPRPAGPGEPTPRPGPPATTAPEGRPTIAPPAPAIPVDAAVGPVRLTLHSQPPGAEVFRLVDGVRLGATPLATEVVRSPGQAVVVLRLAGHDDTRVELPADRDGEARVHLPRQRPRGGHRPKPVHDGVYDPFKK